MQEENYHKNLYDKISERLWPQVETKVDNKRIEKILEGGFLFGFTGSDLLIILASLLTLIFLQLQPYLIPYLESSF